MLGRFSLGQRLALLTVALTFLTDLFPPFLWFFGVPIAAAVPLLGRRFAALLLGMGSVLFATVEGSPFGVLIGFLFGAPALVLGSGMEKNLSAVRNLTRVVVLSLLFLLAITVLAAGSYAGAEESLLDRALMQVQASYEAAQASPEEIEQVMSEVRATVDSLKLLLPTLFFLTVLSGNAAVFYFTRRLLRRMGRETAGLPPLAMWRFPIGAAYLFGFSLVGLYWGTSRNIEPLYMAAINGNLIAMMFGAMQGAGVFLALAQQFSLGVFTRVLFFSMLCFSTAFFQMVAFLGLFDMVFDYRRRLGANQPKE